MGGRTRNWEGEREIGRANAKLAGRTRNWQGEREIGRANAKLGGRTRNWEGEREIGRANLLVSRIMMFTIIERKNGLVARVYEKRFTGRFAQPNYKNRYLDF